MGIIGLFLLFVCGVFAMAMVAPQLAHQGGGRLLAGWAIATTVLTGAVASTAGPSAPGDASLAWRLIVLPTMATVGSGFAALAWAARWRQRRRPAGEGATLVDVLLGVTMWIAGALVAGVMVLAWMLSQLGPGIH